MVVGFTGSRYGMTLGQRGAFADLLRRLGVTELHHGDCVGADKQAHDVARFVGGIWIVAHPPVKERLRAFCDADEVREPKDYLARDRDVVDESERLIVAPRTVWVPKGSGTWYTHDYAKSRGKLVAVLEPERWATEAELMTA